MPANSIDIKALNRARASIEIEALPFAGSRKWFGWVLGMWISWFGKSDNRYGELRMFNLLQIFQIMSI